jgi:4-amino-4-deoxy-L-arabinose transferase-like glycosyltransferase
MDFRPSSFDRRYAAGLLAILVSALALRLAGVHWGLPDAAHPDYSYHPDEMPGVLFARWLAVGRIIVNQFIYGGTLYSSVLNAYFHVANALGVHGVSAMGATIEFGRYASIAYSLAAILVVAAIARRLHGRAAALVAALILAFAPAPLFLSHTLRPDELGMLLVSCAMWLGARVLDADERQMSRYHVATGVLLGTLVAIRYPLAAFAIAPVVAGVMRARPTSARDVVRALFQRGHWIALAIAIPVYCGLSPHTLLYPNKLHEAVLLVRGWNSIAYPDGIAQGPLWFQNAVLMQREGLGWPFHLLAVAGVAWALVRRERAQVFLLLCVLPYFVLTVMPAWVVVRYTLPTAPAFALLAAMMVVDFASRARAVAVV